MNKIGLELFFSKAAYKSISDNNLSEEFVLLLDEFYLKDNTNIKAYITLKNKIVVIQDIVHIDDKFIVQSSGDGHLEFIAIKNVTSLEFSDSRNGLKLMDI